MKRNYWTTDYAVTFLPFSLHCVRSFVFKVIVVTVVANILSADYGKTRILWCIFLWSNLSLFRSSGYCVSSDCCCPLPGWVDSNDVCMSGGSWACGGGTTKGWGHCGHSRWGNTSNHLTVHPPPLYPQSYVIWYRLVQLVLLHFTHI